MAFLPVVEPRRQNLLSSHPAYLAIGIATVVFMGGVHILVVMTALGNDTDTSMVVLAGVALLFLLIGNYLGEPRSNWFFGIRTPWTLSSELSWTRTHRVASWLFIAVGAGTLLTALVAGARGTPEAGRIRRVSATEKSVRDPPAAGRISHRWGRDGRI